MSLDRNLLRVDELVGLEVVDDAAQSPRPRADRSPLVRLRLLASRESLADHALIERVQPIRLNVLIANHGIAPSAREDVGSDWRVVELRVVRRAPFHRRPAAKVD